MKKEVFVLPQKKNFLLLFSLFILSQNFYSQCVSADAIQEFCAIDNKIVADLIVTTGINVVWYDSLTGGNQLSSTTPLVNGGLYYALDTDASCTDPTRFEVLVQIYGKPPTNVDVFVGKCASENPTINDLSANGTNIQWYSEQSGGVLLNDSTPLVHEQTYWVQQTENGCTSIRLPTTVNLITPAPPTVEPTQSFCAIPNPTVYDLQATETNVIWYSSETSTIPLDGTTSLINGEDYWAVQNVFPCESVVRVQTVVTIDTPPNAGTDGSYSECEINLVSTNLFSLLGGSPQDTGVWTGPSALSGGHLGTFEPGINTEGTYTYTVSSTLGICPNETATVEVIIIEILPPTITNSSQAFCEIDNPTVADLIPNGTEVLWYDAETNGNLVNATDALVDGFTYWAAQTDATTGCESLTRDSVTATINVILPPTITNSSQAFCEIDNPTVADLIPNGTEVLWYDAETNGNLVNATDALVDGFTYWAAQTDATTGCESLTRDSVTATINVILPPTITNSSQAFCEIDNPTVADLMPNGTEVLWYDAETNGNLVNATDALVDGFTYWAAQTDATTGCESLTRDSVTATINVILPPTITNSSQAFCEIDNPTVADLIPNGTEVLWYDAETNGNLVNATDALVDGFTYWAAQTDATTGCESLTRDSVTATINVILPPTITNSSQAFCEIDNPTVADLIPNGTEVLWYDAETNGNLVNATDALVDGFTYWAAQTDATTGCESLTRGSVTATINVILPPTITNSSQAFCEIDNPTVADLIPNGTEVLWYDAETNGNLVNATDALVDGFTYWAAQTDATTGCESLTRDSVTATINVILPPTITNSSQAFCEIDNPTVADLIPNGTEVLWYDAETNGNLVNATDALVDGFTYWAAQTDATTGCESLTRGSVTATINVILPPTITNSSQAFCEIDNPTVADLIPNGTEVLWYDAETNGNLVNATDALVDGFTYWAAQTDATTGCESLTRGSVTATINVILPPTITNSSQAFCEIDNPTVADLMPNGTEVLWYDAETNGNLVNATDALVDGFTYWAAQTDATTGCESLTRDSVTATINVILPPTITNSSQAFCEIDNPTVADLMPNGTEVLWYDAETNGNLVNATDALVDGFTYWAAQTDATTGCESLTRDSVTITILTNLPPTTSETTQTFCEIEKATVADLQVIGSEIKWYESETSTIPLNSTDLLINAKDYWASQSGTSSSSCESVSRLKVTASIIAVPPPTTTETNQSFCVNDFLPDTPMISDLLVDGMNIIWYDSETSTTPLNQSDDLVHGQNYWATQTDGTGCESASRLVVNVSVINTPNATTSETTQSFCQSDNPTINNLLVTGDAILWFDTETSTTPLVNTEFLIDGEDYWALNTDATTGCESAARIQITAAIIDIAPPVINNLTQTFCEVNNPTIGSLEATGTVVWFDAETSTIPLDNNDLLQNSTTYWAASINASTGCISSTKIAVNVLLTDPGTPLLERSDAADFCFIDNPSLADLDNRVQPLNNGTITWYDNYPNGNLLSLSEFLIDGETYFAVETNNVGCSSLNALEITVNLNACDDYDIVIYDGFSPNGDGINDTFKIENLRELYPDFKIEFFNRWGNLMYTSDADRPDWNGRLNGENDFAPSGVYYFIINFNKNNRKPLQDRLYLSR